MDPMMTTLVGVLFCLVGSGVGWFIRNSAAQKELKEREVKGDEIIEKAKKSASDIKYNARKEAKEIIQEERKSFEGEVRKKEEQFRETEKGLATKEAKLETKLEENDRIERRLQEKEKDIQDIKVQVEVEKKKFKEKQDQINDKLTEVANMSKDEAKTILMTNMEEEAKVDFAKKLAQLEEEHKENAEEKAKRVIGIAIQRFAGDFVAEKTISSVELPSDDVKGRLIGREGRNIRAFEQICRS